jgi:hypothetical protein
MRSDAQASDVELLRLATSHQTVDNSNIHLTNGSYDRGHWTYRCCITGLCCSYIASIACAVLASGVLGYSENPKDGVYQWARMHTWPHINISPTLGEIVPLAVNVAATALIEATGLIHATTLRWALGRRLTFNSNLRLFASARGSFALGPVANAVHAGLLVLTYTSTSLLFPISPSPEFCEINPVGSVIAECDGLVYLSPPAMGCLAAALFGQAILATWQIISIKVPTWSASPLDTAWASVERGMLTRTPDRCMASVHDISASATDQGFSAKKKQGSAWSAHKQVRKIVYYIIVVTAGCVAWFIILYAVIRAKTKYFATEVPCNGCGIYEGSNWSLIPDQGNVPTSTAVIVEYNAKFHVGLFIIIYIFQAFLTMALCCAELITNLSRDEISWRKCSRRRSYMARPNAVLRAMLSWSAVALFILKAVLHWLFGKAMAYAYNWGIFLRTPQLLYLAIGSVLLATLVVFIALQRPKGNQPATYGHLQTLVDLVDDWHLMMFWGDKGLSGVSQTEEVRHAGTSAMPLGSIVAGAHYLGVARSCQKNLHHTGC